jgi:hypothetical protein
VSPAGCCLSCCTACVRAGGAPRDSHEHPTTHQRGSCVARMVRSSKIIFHPRTDSDIGYSERDSEIGIFSYTDYPASRRRRVRCYNSEFSLILFWIIRSRVRLNAVGYSLPSYTSRAFDRRGRGRYSTQSFDLSGSRKHPGAGSKTRTAQPRHGIRQPYATTSATTQQPTTKDTSSRTRITQPSESIPKSKTE